MNRLGWWRAIRLATVALAAASGTFVAAGLTARQNADPALSEAQVSFGGGSKRFEWVDVYITTASPIGAWQADVSGFSAAATVILTGLEGAANGAAPPRYDAAALTLTNPRLVIGDFSPTPLTAEGGAGPDGKMRVRVARLHLLLANTPPPLTAKLTALADGAGTRTTGTIELVRGQARNP